MARVIRKLSARAVATAGVGRHGDGGGLYLVVSPSGARKWVFRFSWRGRTTEMGLGSATAISLAEARERAAEARRVLADGHNPISARREAERAAHRTPTFGEVADGLIRSKEAGWRNAKHAAQWRMTLERYAAPLRAKAIDTIGTDDVLGVLKPIWLTKPETASRVRGRIEAVLNAAKAQGWRSGENPAAWRGHLAHLLPRRPTLVRGHHAAMPYGEVRQFVGWLRAQNSVAAAAFEFCILTAARSGEVLGARWEEIDWDEKVWTVPAARMKSGREHRVPLSQRAMEILEAQAKARSCDYIFPGRGNGRPLSSMALLMILRRAGLQCTAHGFRSAFRDWAGNETNVAREVAEAALAHVVGDKAEQAYRRGDALAKRRKLMEAWARYIEPRDAGNVITLAANRANRHMRARVPVD